METLPEIGKASVTIPAAYALGCLVTGYYLVRATDGRDIRTLGSGSAGSRNVGRALGPYGFAIVLLGDALKGATAVGAALWFDLHPWIVNLVMLAVVAGHVWPAQLGFRGGKGLATAAGAALVFDYSLVALLVVAAVASAAVLRRVTPAALIAVALSPGLAALMGHPAEGVLGVALLALTVLVAHRQNIRGAFDAARRPGR